MLCWSATGTAGQAVQEAPGCGKHWEEIEEAKENETVLEGFVTEDNKGGVVVSVKAIRVFVPASQTGLPRETPMNTLLKQKVRLVITRSTVPAAAWWLHQPRAAC